MKIPRFLKITLVYIIDIINCLAASYISYALRLDVFQSFSKIFLIHLIDFKIFILPIIIFTPIFILFRFYTNIFRYLNIYRNKNITIAFMLYFVIYIIGSLYIKQDINLLIPRSSIILQPLIFYFLFILSRYIISSLIFGSIFDQKKILKIKRCLIIGTNNSSVKIVNFLNSSSSYRVYGFVDEENKIGGQTINNIKVYNLTNILKAINDFNITDFLVSIENLDKKKKELIFNDLKKYKKPINFIPIEKNLVNFKELKLNQINYEEILFPRKETNDLSQLNKFFLNKTVAISGAGGSIGSELSKEIYKLDVKKLILIEKSEIELFFLKKKIDKLDNRNIEIEFILGDLTDLFFVKKIFRNSKIDIFYHAAAYKHVELLEKNYYSAIKNNLISTLNTCKQAIENKVSIFCLISSDKAVKPKSIMGMTKKYCEKILLNFKNNKNSVFYSVRFGNVINSSGSVIPIFKEQIENQLPLTVTDRNVSRYFMRISDAISLVLKSTLIAENKKIYALDMGKPYKIYNIAKKMISAYGYTLKRKKTGGDIEIKLIGLKPGEKLKEEIFLGKRLKKTSMSKVFIETNYDKPIKNFLVKTKKIISLLESNQEKKGVELFKKLLK